MQQVTCPLSGGQCTVLFGRGGQRHQHLHLHRLGCILFSKVSPRTSTSKRNLDFADEYKIKLSNQTVPNTV